jgi:hypothetical protein
MSILVLNKRPLAAAPYHEWLAECGDDLHLVTCARNQSPRELERIRDRYASVAIVPDYDVSGEVELHALALDRRAPIHRIVALSEVDIVRAAGLRARLGLPGQTPASALAYRDKLEMKRVLRAAGIPVARSAPVDAPLDLIAFVDEHGFPVVLKPRGGGGSVGVRVIADHAALRAELGSGLAPGFDRRADLMVEAFVPGEVHHVDGVILNGRPHLTWPSRYLDSPLCFQEDHSYGGAMLGVGNPLTPRLQDLTHRVIAELPDPGPAAFHAEIFVSQAGELTLGEIASRAGGGGVAHAVHAGFGVDINACAARAQVGLPVTLDDGAAAPIRLAGWVLVPPRAGRLVAAARTCPLPYVVGASVTDRVGEVFSRAAHSVDQVGLFILVADDEAELRRRCGEVQRWFEASCVWEPAPHLQEELHAAV